MEESKTTSLRTGRLFLLAVVTISASAFLWPFLTTLAKKIGIDENVGRLTAGAIVLALILILMPKKNMREFGWCRSENTGNWKFIIPILCMCVFNIPYLFLTTAFNPVYIALVNAALVAFAEELACRGYLLRALETKLGERRAILLSGMVFGLFHLINLTHEPAKDVLLQILYTFVIGIVFAVVRVKTKSLFWPIIAHTALNFVYELTTDNNDVLWLDTLFTIFCTALAVAYGVSYEKGKILEAERKASA